MHTIKELKDTISALNDDLDTAKKAISELETQISDLNHELDCVKGESSTMARRVRQNQWSRDEDHQRHIEEVNLLRKKIRDLEYQVEGLKRRPGEYY